MPVPWLAIQVFGSVGVGAPAWACEPLEPVPFVQKLNAAQASLLDDDVAAHRASIDELEDGLACATFELDSESLGRLLLHATLAREAAGEPWTSHMATAVRIAPSMERLVGAGHPIDRWLPPPVPVDAPTYEVSEDVRVLVDGEPRPRYFTLSPDAVHLVQYWEDGQLRNRWLEAGEGLEGSGPAWRYVSTGEQRLRRKKARRWFAGVGGGLAAVGLGAAVVATRENHLIATGNPEDRLVHRSRRNTAGAVAGTASAAAGVVFGVGWSVQW